MKVHSLLAFSLLMSAVPAAAADRTERVQFQRGTVAKTLKGTLRGYDGVNYLVGAKAGQALDVTVSSPNPSVYFNVFAPGSDGEAIFASDRDGGNRFKTSLSATGDYRVQVYLYRNAARRGATANYSVTIGAHK